MEEGGKSTQESLQSIVRLLTLAIPVVLVFYSLLIQLRVVDTTHQVHPLISIGITVTWLAVGVAYSLVPQWSEYGARGRLVSYYILALAYCLFVSGFSAPFAFLWIILLIITYIMTERKGLLLGLIVLIGAIIYDIILRSVTAEATPFFSDMLMLGEVIVVTLAGVAIIRAFRVDVQTLKTVEQRESLQRDRVTTIVNNLADAVVSTDDAGKIQIYNAASLNLFDTNEDIADKKIDDILPLVDEDGNTIQLSAVLASSSSVRMRDDLYLQLEDESIRLEITYSPIRSSFSRTSNREVARGYVLILRDVTKEKSLEEERDEFISVVSHELRTPITIVEGTLDTLLLMRKRKISDESVVDTTIADAHKQVLYLAGMVNDLSTLSRAERGVADESETIDVRDMMNELYNQYQPEAAEKQLRFDLDLGAGLGAVHVSRLYLAELLQNFITNAIKYTVKGSVTLSVHQKNDTITFAVSDTGIGMSKADQKNIFNKFYRSEDYRTRETSGTGLGLYVVTKLARKLGTSVSLKSRLNHGSTFSFSLKRRAKDYKKK